MYAPKKFSCRQHQGRTPRWIPLLLLKAFFVTTPSGCKQNTERSIPAQRKFGPYPTAQPPLQGDAESSGNITPSSPEGPVETEGGSAPGEDSDRTETEANPAETSPAVPTDSPEVPQEPAPAPPQPTSNQKVLEIKMEFGFKKNRNTPNFRHGSWNGVCMAMPGKTNEELCTKKISTASNTNQCWVYNETAQGQNHTFAIDLPQSSPIELSFTLQISSAFCNGNDDASGFIYTDAVKLTESQLQQRVKCYSEVNASGAGSTKFLICFEDTASQSRSDFKFDDVAVRLSAENPFQLSNLTCEPAQVSQRTCWN
jgi:hypothetical protein